MNSQQVMKIRTMVTNVYLVRGERTVLVGTGTPGNAARIVQAMGRLGLKPQQVSLILITHGHADHFGGVAALQQMIGAPVAIGRADAWALRSGHNPPTPGQCGYSAIW
jgi:glyoxylase-like metal-dependent hydrolase (beta-lactamase superfamily II)